MTTLKNLDEDVREWFEFVRKDYMPNPNNRMREEWLSVSYPNIWCNKVVHYLWKVLFCRIGFHLFDEVQSVTDHSLYCDACDFTIHIAKDNKPIFEEED